MAAMIWSRITSRDRATNFIREGIKPYYTSKPSPGWSPKNYTMEEVGLMYPVKDTLIHIRPTLERSPWLYIVFGLQPALTVIMFVLITIFHSTPVGQGFGVVSILAGVERRSLDALYGAALSGELTKDVTLNITPVPRYDGGALIEYHIGSTSDSDTDMRNGTIKSKIVYS